MAMSQQAYDVVRFGVGREQMTMINAYSLRLSVISRQVHTVLGSPLLAAAPLARTAKFGRK
jgi:hypothetical protein